MHRYSKPNPRRWWNPDAMLRQIRLQLIRDRGETHLRVWLHRDDFVHELQRALRSASQAPTALHAKDQVKQSLLAYAQHHRHFPIREFWSMLEPRLVPQAAPMVPQAAPMVPQAAPNDPIQPSHPAQTQRFVPTSHRGTPAPPSYAPPRLDSRPPIGTPAPPSRVPRAASQHPLYHPAPASLHNPEPSPLAPTSEPSPLAQLATPRQPKVPPFSRRRRRRKEAQRETPWWKSSSVFTSFKLRVNRLFGMESAYAALCQPTIASAFCQRLEDASVRLTIEEAHNDILAWMRTQPVFTDTPEALPTLWQTLQPLLMRDARNTQAVTNADAPDLQTPLSNSLVGYALDLNTPLPHQS